MAPHDAPAGCIVTGYARKGYDRLRDIVARISLDSRPESFDRCPIGIRTDQHTVAAGLANRFDHQLREVLEDIPKIAGIRAKVRLHITQDRLFSEVVADESWDVC